jgi:hypothetical protein
MMDRFIALIVRQNHAYDALDDAHPWLRFSLFMLPMLLALVVDCVLTVVGLVEYAYTFYVVMFLMAAWRFIGNRCG